jgi:hypothetical protein
MRVEIKRNVMISGEPAAAGSFVELEDAAAMLLIGMGKAVFAPAVKPEPVKQPEPKPEPVKEPAVQPTKPVFRRGRTSSSTPKD